MGRFVIRYLCEACGRELASGARSLEGITPKCPHCGGSEFHRVRVDLPSPAHEPLVGGGR